MQTSKLVRLLAAVSILAFAVDARAQSAEVDYARFCSGCHGPTFRAPSQGGRSAAEIATLIRNGSRTGMPAFGERLSDAQIQALVEFVRAPVAPGKSMVGVTIEGESLDEGRSAGYVIMTAQDRSQTRYIGYFGERSLLCYDDIDLTGVRSIELNYARGANDPARFAVLVGERHGAPQINVGEKATTSTGGWETFERRRIGLDREMTGPHLLCFYGVQNGGIFNLDSFTLSDRPAEHDGVTFTFNETSPPVLEAAGYRFVLEKVADAPAELWSMAFLPDGSMLATRKSGQLLLFDKNGKRLGAIEGLPEVWDGVQGGLLAVKPHPDYAKNGWIYLSFSDPGPDKSTAMTRVVRGKLDGLRWVEQQDIYRAEDRFYTQNYAHFGSRIAFADGYVYVSVGERQQSKLAQDLSYPYGKVHRLHDDGRIPRDNPFVGRDGALASIWSYGHRNPQGMTAHPQTGAIWSAEHGPAGGDEVNLIRRGANYGWPLVSFGKHYDGTEVGPSPYRDGIEPPVHHWTPSIAVSQIEFYFGDAFPEWRGQLLAASLGSQELHLVRIRDNRAVDDRLLFKGFGRIRDVTVGPDGYPYVLLNQFAAGIYRMRPVQTPKAEAQKS